MPSIHDLIFDFWGVTTTVSVRHQNDLKRLQYYFSDYLIENPENLRNEHSIAISLEGSSEGYFDSPPGDRKCSIWTSPDKGIGAEPRSLSELSATPIPPFYLKPLKDTVRTVHGVALGSPGDGNKGLLIHGESTVGKTTLLLSLLQRGWKFISDDLVPIRNESSLLRFTRPIGLRQSVAKQLDIKVDECMNVLRFNTPTGLTTVIHPSQMKFPIGKKSTPLRWTVILKHNTEYSTSLRTDNVLEINFNIAEHRDLAIREIEEFTSC